MNSIFLDLISIHTWSLMSMVLESYEVLVVVQSNLKCCCTITSFENHQNLKSSGTIKTDITRDILKLRSFENMSSHLLIVFNSCHWMAHCTGENLQKYFLLSCRKFHHLPFSCPRQISTGPFFALLPLARYNRQWELILNWRSEDRSYGKQKLKAVMTERKSWFI